MKYLPALTVLLTAILIYAATAFALWEWNPAKWDPMERGTMAFAGLFFAALAAGLAFEITKKD